MSINRNNYETYLIDYLDGTLHPNEVAEVLLFLEQHADIKQEYEALGGIVLYATETNFNSSMLLKSEHNRNQLLLFKEIEGNLSHQEALELKTTIKQNSKLFDEQKLFALTIQKPDLSVIYQNKNALKKSTLTIEWYTPFLRIAAVIMLLSSIGFVYVKLNQPQPSIANYKKNKGQTIIKQDNIEQLKLASAQIKTLKSKATNNGAEKVKLDEVVKIHKVIATTEKVSPISTQIIATTLTADIDPQLNFPTLSIAKANTQIKQDQYDDIKSLVAKRVKQNTNQLIGETDTNKEITLVSIINKTTGVDLTINKDTTSGRINRFEVAALGFAWSRK